MNLALKCVTFFVSLGKILQWFGFFFHLLHRPYLINTMLRYTMGCISYSTEKESGIVVELRIPYLPV